MLPGGPGTGPGPVAMRRGGRVGHGKGHGKAESTAAKVTTPPIRQGVSDKERRFANGGVVQSSQDGAGGGLGRLNKVKNERRSRGSE